MQRLRLQPWPLLAVTLICCCPACKPPTQATTIPAAKKESSTAAAESKPTTWTGFPKLPPIKDADPNVRVLREIKVPTKLQIERSEFRIGVTIDEASLQSEPMLVGQNMIVGYEWTEHVLSEGKVLSSQRAGLSGGLGSGTSFFNTNQDGFPLPGQKYTVEVHYTIFETDIAPQHMWSPTGGKYKVLKTGTLRAEVD